MTITQTTAQTQFPLTDGAVRPDRLVLTIAEAGELLGISRAFAYELAARGELPVLRLGRRLLVPRRALLELVGAGPEAGASPSS